MHYVWLSKFLQTKSNLNKTGCLGHINLNSKVILMSNNFAGNEIYKNAYYIAISHITLNNTKFNRNTIKALMFAKSQSHVSTINFMLTNNQTMIDWNNV